MNINKRRRFLKQTLTTVMYAALFHPFRRLIASQPDEHKLPAWMELVECARWCPSVHNLQPHKLKIISNNEAELYYDPYRLLPVGDPHSIFATVAMGVFIEHLTIVASSYGAKVQIARVFDPITTHADGLTLFAKLLLTTTTEKDELDRELIMKRRTSRWHYDGVPLKQETLNNIKKETEKYDHEFFSTSDEELISSIKSLNQQTLFADLESKPDRDELDRLFRYTREEAEAKKDGLWAKCMGFSGKHMKSVFLRHERWGKGIRKKMLASQYNGSFKGTSTICWFGGKFDNTNDWLQAGRVLSRSWLLITKDQAYIQPFGSLITNNEAYEKINKKFTRPKEGKKIWFIFRAGYSNEPARSFRLNTEDIIIK